MEVNWKRPKCIPSITRSIETNEGNLHLIFGFEDEKLIEVRGNIGKAGSFANTLVDTICKLISMYLQSPEPRYKIIKKFKKQFEDMEAGIDPFTYEGIKYTCTIDVIVKLVVKELEKQIGEG